MGIYNPMFLTSDRMRYQTRMMNPAFRRPIAPPGPMLRRNPYSQQYARQFQGFPVPSLRGGGQRQPSLPGFLGLGAGGLVQLDPQGGFTLRPPDVTGMYQSYLQNLANMAIAQGNQRTQLDVTRQQALADLLRQRIQTGGQLGVAQYGLQGTQFRSLADLMAARAQAQSQLQAAIEAAQARRYGAEMGYRGTLAQAQAQMFPAMLAQQRFETIMPMFSNLVDRILPEQGGTGPGTFQPMGVPQIASEPTSWNDLADFFSQALRTPIDSQRMVNQALAQNAASYGGALQGGMSGMAAAGASPSSPATQGLQALLAARQAAGDVQARTQVPIDVAEANANIGLQGLQAILAKRRLDLDQQRAAIEALVGGSQAFRNYMSPITGMLGALGGLA